MCLRNHYCFFLVTYDSYRCVTFNIGSNIFYREGSSSTFRQRFFVKEEFHYLNVSVVGTSSVYDVLDCTFKYICNPLCFSVNLAASTEADGEAWCELLSSDKYRNSREYTDSRNAHHLFLKVKDLSFHETYFDFF